MNDISSIPSVSAPVFARAAVSVADHPETRFSAADGDSLELSELGALLADLRPSTAPNAIRVGELRAAIQDGDYETPEKLARVVDRLHAWLTRPAQCS